eukprot:TRINITY_DN4147_c0_g1_i1.p1 TRINITY_DN4147_c0_g1~~TRINITY_DN4147_c0_g1_i1.p1  ORF type:complete len:476 (+),score=137.76 TRINITY_DN4147_c0_g1_i1:18-1445(+)
MTADAGAEARARIASLGERVRLVGVRVRQPSLCGAVLRDLAAVLPSGSGSKHALKRVVDADDGTGHKIVLLAPRYQKLEDLPEHERHYVEQLLVPQLPRPVEKDRKKDIKKTGKKQDKEKEVQKKEEAAEQKQPEAAGHPKLQPLADVVEHWTTLDHTCFTAEQILRKLLPPEIKEIPSSFEAVGTIAHVNLKDEQLPYRHLIGEAILAKNKQLKTVVNKLGTIDAKFRTFAMDVIAGENNFITDTSEGQCTFRMNYAEVYWNSRLQTEHARLVALFKPSDIICDVFAGIGPFALPAAKRGCTVYANDLNPRSYYYLCENAKLNKVARNVKAFNMDGRDFVRHVLNTGVKAHHFLMNLPASAVEFLDVFREFLPPSEHGEADLLPVRVHCYTFSKAASPSQDALEQVHKLIPEPAMHDVLVTDVRDVSPHKRMLCVSFGLHLLVPGTATPVADADKKRKHVLADDAASKRQKVAE